MAVDQNPVLSRGPSPLCCKPLSRPAVSNPLSRISVAIIRLSILPQGSESRRVCRQIPPSVTNQCREMAAQACYKPYVFGSLPYILPENLGNYVGVFR